MKQRLIDASKLSAQLRLKYGFGPSADSMQELIDAAPTVDAVPTVHAIWRHQSTIDGEGTEYMCSCCDNIEIYKTPYCCCCGSKMDLEDDGK